MSHYDTTKARILQWIGIILILCVFGGAYWYFKVYGSTLNSPSTDPLGSGLVGYWKLDDGSGTSATDSSTNGNTGTLTNGPTWTTGQIGGAVSFDGTNDHITAGTDSSLRLTSKLSISAWVYLSALPSNGDIWSIAHKKSSGDSNYLYSFGLENSGGNYKLAYIPGGGGSTNRSNTLSISTGQWYHFAVTFDQPTLNFYVNGSLNSTQSITVPGGYASGSGTMYIGGVGGVGNTINGRLDEVRIYNRPLSGDEMAQLSRLSSVTDVDTNLNGYWTFDGKDISGTTAFDRSGAGNNGTLTNSPQTVEGKTGQALNFFPSGSDANARMTITDPTSGNLDFGSGDFSVGFWMRNRGYSDQTSSINAVLAKKSLDTASAAGYAFYYGSTNLITFFVGNGSSSASVATNTSIADSVWHYYVGQRSGSTLTLYMDGVAIGTATLSGSVSNSDTFVVGSDDVGGNGNTRNANADIDEVRVYSAALSTGQIQSLYALGQSDKINSSISQPGGTGRLESGLAGYWALDDGSGTSATNSSVNSNTGTLTNGPTWTTGQIGGAVDFDGTNDYITVADADALDITGNLTFSAWIKADTYPSAGSYRTLVTKGSFGIPAVNYSIRLYGANTSDQRLDFGYYASAATQELYGGTNITTGTWYHVAVIYDDAANVLNLYVNGAKESTTTLSGSPTTNSLAANTYALDVGQQGGTYNFDGQIDELRLYNRTLSADEISQLYRLTTPTLVDTGLMAYWSFNAQDMSGNTAYDRSGRPGNSGTTSNTTKVEGKIGQGLYFNGSNSIVSISAPSPSLSTPTYATYSAWVYTNGDPGHAQYILREGNGSVYSLYLAATTRNLTFGNVSGTRDSGYAIPINTWTHVALTIDNGTGIFYVDGVKVNQQSFTVSGIGSSAYVYLGAFDNGPTNEFNGNLDEIRIHSRALTAAEIKGLYDAGQSDKLNSSVSQPQGAGRLDSGLTAYYKLDDGSGTSATDSSTNGNTGTLTNGPTWTTGQVGSAVDFDGTNDYISAADIDALDSTSNVTVSAWVNADNWTGQSASLISNLVKKDGNYILRKSTDGITAGIKFFWWNGSGNIRYASVTTLPSTGAWHHIVGVAANNDVVGVYIDGALASGTVSTYLPGTRVLTNILEIGSAAGGTESLDGRLDEVRIYNRALSADEIGQLYRLASPTGVDTSLKGYWSFNGKDLSGTTAYDISGAGNNGTLTNGPIVTEGKIGQGLSFDGNNDSVNITYNANLNLTSAITLSAWVKTSKSTKQVILNRTTGSSPYNGYELNVSDDYGNCGGTGSTGRPGFWMGTTSGSLCAKQRIDDGNWHLVTASYDGTTGRIYVDGVLDTATAMTNQLNNTSSTLYIGTQVTSFFQGSIDEVRIYNTALSAAQIQTLYNQGR